jgi:hypothetical protein
MENRPFKKSAKTGSCAKNCFAIFLRGWKTALFALRKARMEKEEANSRAYFLIFSFCKKKARMEKND